MVWSSPWFPCDYTHRFRSWSSPPISSSLIEHYVLNMIRRDAMRSFEKWLTICFAMVQRSSKRVKKKRQAPDILSETNSKYGFNYIGKPLFNPSKIITCSSWILFAWTSNNLLMLNFEQTLERKNTNTSIQ